MYIAVAKVTQYREILSLGTTTEPYNNIYFYFYFNQKYDYRMAQSQTNGIQNLISDFIIESKKQIFLLFHERILTKTGSKVRASATERTKRLECKQKVKRIGVSSAELCLPCTKQLPIAGWDCARRVSGHHCRK